MTVFLQNPFDNLPLEGYRKQRYWMMAEAFVRAGHEVVLWTSAFNHTTKGSRELNVSSDRGRLRVGERFEVCLVPTPPYSRNVGLRRVWSHRAYAKAWRRLAEAEKKAPGLIVTSVPTVSAALAAQSLARKFGARLVVDVQDAWPETFERLAPKGLGFAARLMLSPLRRKVRRLYHEADFVTGVCERYRLLTSRPEYLCAYLGVELVRRPNENPGKRPKGPVLVYAGNLGISYDLGTVIRGLHDEVLHVAGKGIGETAWRDLAKKLGKERQVVFHGYLDEGALRKLFAQATIGIVPMRDDTFIGVPNKFCEYAAAGLRIVSSLSGESAELLRKYRSGATYESGDPRSFAEAVRKASACDGRQSVRMAEIEFDAVRIYDDYVRTVENVLSLPLRAKNGIMTAE